MKKLGLHEIFYVEKLHFPMAYCGYDKLMTLLLVVSLSK